MSTSPGELLRDGPSAPADRLDRWRVLEPDAGRFLWSLTQTLDARPIVEIGTSRGLSTLWLAHAARHSLTGSGLADRMTIRSRGSRRPAEPRSESWTVFHVKPERFTGHEFDVEAHRRCST